MFNTDNAGRLPVPVNCRHLPRTINAWLDRRQRYDNQASC